jgi:hypothetical protein
MKTGRIESLVSWFFTGVADFSIRKNQELHQLFSMFGEMRMSRRPGSDAIR